MDLFGFGSDVGGEGSKGEQSPNLTRRTQKLIDASVAIRGGAPDGDEIAFLHSTFCQVALPRTRPPGLVFERTSGAASIRLEAGTLWDGERHVQQSLPYGTRPRLLLMHMIRSYLRTRDRNIDLGESVRDFLVNTLHVSASGGPRGGLTSFRQQVHALAGCRISIGINAGGGQAVSHPNKQLIDRFAAWPIDESGRRTLLPHQLTLTREFAEAIEQSSVPLDLRAIRAVQDSALSLDVYAWLAHRLWRMSRPTMVYWQNLREQFGQEVADPRTFKRNFTKSLREVMEVYPQAKIQEAKGGLRLMPSKPPVPPTTVVAVGRSERAALPAGR